MCNFCNIDNKIESINVFNDEEENRILNAIYLGFITPEHLDYKSYILIATFLETECYRGYGKSINEVTPGDKDESLLRGFKHNIFAFSAAKVFQQTLELINDRNKTIDEWLLKARIIFKKYNSEYLAVEGDSSYHQGLGAKNFIELTNWSYERNSAG